MQISVIIKPSPEAVEALRTAVERLREQGHTVHPRVTFETGDAHRFAWKSAEYGADLVVACGGDGTINEVVNGLYDWIEEREKDGKKVVLPRVGIVPLGTGNDLAGGMGIATGDPAGALLNAANGEEYPVDVARVNGRYFLNVSTGGIGAEATDEASSDLKRTLGPIAYVVTGVKKFVHLKASHARFTSGGETVYKDGFLLFAVGNAWRTGGGNWVTSDADPADCLLDLCIVQEMTHMELVRIAPQIRAGTHVNDPKVTYLKVRELTVESDEEMTVNADGEPLTARRFEYDLGPHRLTLMVPHAPAEGEAGAPGAPAATGKAEGGEIPAKGEEVET
ncbi:diacylglycerol/lipid kinase family protein [Longimicrobium sp.]|uniref:diacylglycerol/lipid kinase family protein n=1 Tax=Longimicrobium sp. TaxID=2029185 RepID=UPI003B3A146D